MPSSKHKVLTFEKGKSGGSTILGAVGFIKEECRKVCLRMVVIDELQFSLVEGEGFYQF